MRVPTSCRSITSDVEAVQHLGASARASRCRASRPARGGPSSRRVRRLDHVLLHVGPEPVLRAEDGRRAGARGCAASRSAMCTKPWSTDAGLQTTPTRRPSRRADGQQPFGAELNAHGGDYFTRSLPADAGWLSLRSLTCLCAGAVDRLRAFGGQPRLLRPRREPIEPQFRLVLSSTLLPSRRAAPPCVVDCRERVPAVDRARRRYGSKALRRESSVHDGRGGAAGAVQPRRATSNRFASCATPRPGGRAGSRSSRWRPTRKRRRPPPSSISTRWAAARLTVNEARPKPEGGFGGGGGFGGNRGGGGGGGGRREPRW